MLNKGYTETKQISRTFRETTDKQNTFNKMQRIPRISEERASSKGGDKDQLKSIDSKRNCSSMNSKLAIL